MSTSVNVSSDRQVVVRTSRGERGDPTIVIREDGHFYTKSGRKLYPHEVPKWARTALKQATRRLPSDD